MSSPKMTRMLGFAAVACCAETGAHVSDTRPVAKKTWLRKSFGRSFLTPRFQLIAPTPCPMLRPRYFLGQVANRLKKWIRDKWPPQRRMSDVGHFSNRPFGVKHFQTIHRCGVDVAHGLALLFGIGAKALPLWDSRMRWSNLCSGLAVRRNGRSKRTCELTSSIVPRGTSSTARWSSSFLLLDLIL